MCLLKSTKHAQRALDILARAVAPFRMRFSSSEYKVLLQYWITADLN